MFGSHWSWPQEGSKNTKITDILLSRLEKVYSSCFLADLRCPSVDASHTSATTSMSQSFSTFNFVDVKNIEVPLARSAPSNTYQSQSIAEDRPVILSVTASPSRWKHRQHTAAGWRKSSQPWSRKWRTTVASLELRRCLHYWWQSDGKEQSLVSATLPPTKQEEGECVPKDRADSG